MLLKCVWEFGKPAALRSLVEVRRQFPNKEKWLFGFLNRRLMRMKFDKIWKLGNSKSFVTFEIIPTLQKLVWLFINCFRMFQPFWHVVKTPIRINFQEQVYFVWGRKFVYLHFLEDQNKLTIRVPWLPTHENEVRQILKQGNSKLFLTLEIIPTLETSVWLLINCFSIL